MQLFTGAVLKFSSYTEITTSFISWLTSAFLLTVREIMKVFGHIESFLVT